jgi:hypothetical protein
MLSSTGIGLAALSPDSAEALCEVPLGLRHIGVARHPGPVLPVRQERRPATEDQRVGAAQQVAVETSNASLLPYSGRKWSKNR